MRVYMQLQKALDSSRISKNAIIRTTGIDRSTFYQIIHGKRKATSDQLIRIMDSIEMDSDGRRDLLYEYEREREGDTVYQQRTAVRNFLNQLAEDPEPSSERTCPEKIRQVIQDAALSGDGKLQIFLPGSLMIRTGIYAELMHAVKENHLEVEYLSVYSEGDDETALNFGNVAKCLHCYHEKNLEIRMYHLDGIRIPSDGIPFPYYIVTKDTLLLISSSAEDVFEISDPEQRKIYREFFEEQMQKARPLIAINRDDDEMFERMAKEYTHALQAGLKLYFIAPQPCVMLTVTKEQLLSYVHDERLAQYSTLMNALDVQEFTSPSGIARLLKERKIAESGMNIEIRDEDVPLLQKDLERRLHRNLFLLNDDNVHLSRYWEMMIFENEKVIFAPFCEGGYIISVTHPTVVNAMTDWCESRTKIINADVVLSDSRE